MEEQDFSWLIYKYPLGGQYYELKCTANNGTAAYELGLTVPAKYVVWCGSVRVGAVRVGAGRCGALRCGVMRCGAVLRVRACRCVVRVRRGAVCHAVRAVPCRAVP